MSREIKFDIITLHTSGLKHYEHLIVTLDELIKLIPRKITGHVDLWRFSGEIIAKRQFTGLTDKNGKDAYEFDLLSNSIAFGIVKFGVYDMKIADNTDDYHVEHFNGWYLDFDHHLKGLREHLVPNSVTGREIIGNIYENSDLLNEAN